MVALAPNTSETSSWDVLDGFPKLHSRAREVKTTRCTEAPALKSLECVEIWQVVSESCAGLESFTRDPIGYLGGVGVYSYVNSNPLYWLDPEGTNPLAVAKVIFSVLSIASSVNTIQKNLDDRLPAPWPSPFGNDYRIPNSFNFTGEPGGISGNSRNCPCGSKRAVIFYDRWSNAFASDEYKIELVFNYCKGAMSGHTIGTGYNSMYRVAWITESVNGSKIDMPYECECLKVLPCASVTFAIRRYVDNPWPIWDWDAELSASFTACADGTLTR